MNKKNIRVSRKGASKIHVVNLDDYLRKSKHVVMAITEIKGKPKTSMIRVKQSVKKIGRNYIVVSELKDFKPEVLGVSPTLEKYEISPHLFKLARLMQRIPNATIKRMARDIIDV